MCVLLANEPRAYRDTLAVALRMLRPDAEVIVADPETLDAAVLQHGPNVVICSEVTYTVETQVPTWVLLYPEGDGSAVRHVAGERTTLREIDLAEIARLITPGKCRASP